MTRETVTGQGAAGVPVGGVLSVQEVGQQLAEITQINTKVQSDDPTAIIARGSSAGSTASTSYVLAASSNLTQIKGSPGVVYDISVGNSSATGFYVFAYDALAVNVTVGTTVPVWREYCAPTNSARASFSVGLPFLVGITFAVSRSPSADTPVALNDGVVSFNRV